MKFGSPTTYFVRAAMVAGVVLAVAVLEGCARPAADGGVVGSGCVANQFAPPFTQIDGCSPSQVVLAAIQTAFSYRPDQQADQGASYQSATPLMVGALAAREDTTAHVLAPVTGALWQRWRDLGVSVVASVRLGSDDHPPDTELSFARVAQVTLHPDGQDPLPPFSVFVEAARSDSAAGWRVSALEVRT